MEIKRKEKKRKRKKKVNFTIENTIKNTIDGARLTSNRKDENRKSSKRLFRIHKEVHGESSRIGEHHRQSANMHRNHDSTS